MIALVILWILCPFALIPLVIVFGIQNSKLKKRNSELERIQGYQVQQQQNVQPQQVAQQLRQTTAPQQNVQPQQVAQQLQQTTAPQQNVQTQQVVQQTAVSQQTVVPQQNIQPQQSQLQQSPSYSTSIVQPVKKQRTKISTMNLIFIIGVLFVIIAGVIFATTTWRILPNFVKVTVIFLSIVLFFAAAIFAKRKLRLTQTSLTFYSLGSLFIPISMLGMGYFKMLGSYLSLDGDGKFLLGFIGAACLTVACLYGARYYKSHLFIWLSYASETMAVFFLCWQVVSDYAYRCLLLALYCTIVVLLKGVFLRMRDKYEELHFLRSNLLKVFSRYADIIFYAVGTILVLIGIFDESSVWVLSLLCILFSMTWSIIAYQQKWMCWLHPFVTLIVIIGISNLSIVRDYREFIFSGLCTVAFLLYLLIRNKDGAMFRTVISDVLYIIAGGIASLVYTSETWASGQSVFMNHAAPIVVTACVLIMMVTLAFRKETDIVGKIVTYLVPWNALCLLFTINRVFEKSILNQLFLVFFMFFMLFTLLIVMMTKNKSILRRIVLPFSIMLSITGGIVCILELVILDHNYELIYLWFFTLFAVVKLYEKLSYKLHRWSQIWLYASVLLATLASATTLDTIWTDMSTEYVLLILMSITMLLLVVNTFISPVQRFLNTLEKDVRLSLSILLHFYIYTLFCLWYFPEVSSYGIGLILILAVIICQVVLYRQRNTVLGFISLIPLQFIISGILSTFEMNQNVYNVIISVEMFVLIIIGRLFYKNVLQTETKTDEKQSAHYIDWISIYAVSAPLSLLLYANDIWSFAAKFLIMIYALNFLKRVSTKANKYIYSVVAALVCNAVVTQPFVAIPKQFALEANILVVLLFVACLYKCIWVGYEKYLSKVFFIVLFSCFLIQAVDCLPGESNADILILLIGVLAVAIYAAIRKSRKYSILTQALLVIGITVVGNIEKPSITDVMVHINYIAIVICAVLCQWSLYRRRRLWAGIVPVAVFLALYAKWILLFDFTVNVSMLAWILIFMGMLVLSRVFNRNHTFIIAKEEVSIDWYAIMNIVPVVILLVQENEMWHFGGLIMLFLYLLSFYQRIHIKADKLLITFAAFVLCMALWTQPFFTVPEIIYNEWNMIILVLFTAFLYVGVWKQYEKIMSWLFCAVVSVCVVCQGYDAIADKELLDVLVLGICALIILLVSFWIKSKRWFLLASITLVTLTFYLSRDFWMNLAWWIYLLATGIILISVASVNEYYKKKGEKADGKLKRMMQEWEW